MITVAELRKLSLVDLRNLHSLVTHELNQLINQNQAQLAATFRVGDKVLVKSNKVQAFPATVEKINRKTILVDGGEQGKWKVTPGLLAKL